MSILSGLPMKAILWSCLLEPRVVIDRKALRYLSELPEKSQRLIKERCRLLAEDPLPGQGSDKELLHLQFKLYRLHVGRSFTRIM